MGREGNRADHQYTYNSTITFKGEPEWEEKITNIHIIGNRADHQYTYNSIITFKGESEWEEKVTEQITNIHIIAS